MADPDVLSLQIAVNRYANRAFVTSAIATDGVIGPQTAVGVVNALRDISANSEDEGDTARGLYVNLTASGAIDQDQVASSAKGLAEFLNTTGNEMNLPAGVARPMIASGSGGGSSPGLPVRAGGQTTSAATINAEALWAGLPTWQKVLAGVVAGLALLFIAGHLHKNGPTLKGLLGPADDHKRRKCDC